MSRPKPIAKKRRQGAKEYRSQALERLRQRFEKENESEFDASGEVTITPLLKSAEGGIPRILEALRAHDNDDARDFMEFYDSLSGKDRKHLKLEEIAVAAGIDSLRLAEIATSAMILHGEMTTRLIIASSMKKVLKATVKAATDQVPIVADLLSGERKVVGHTNGDVRAMELFGKMSGLVPIPKGATINFQNNVTTEKAEIEEKETPAYLDAGQRLRLIHEAVDQRQLPSPSREPLPVGGHIDRLQGETVEIMRGE